MTTRTPKTPDELTTMITTDLNNRRLAYACIIQKDGQPSLIQVHVPNAGWTMDHYHFELDTNLGLLALADSITIPGYTSKQGCGRGGEITTKYVRN